MEESGVSIFLPVIPVALWEASIPNQGSQVPPQVKDSLDRHLAPYSGAQQYPQPVKHWGMLWEQTTN